MARRRRRRRSPETSRALTLVVAVLAVLAVAFAVLLSRREGPPEPARTEPPAPRPGEALEARPPSRPPASRPPDSSDPAVAPAPDLAQPGGPPAAAAGARVALVIDDLGRSLADLDSLDRLGVPFTYSVLPFESLTREVAAELTRRRKEVLCHLPMEGGNGANPGLGALTRDMTPAELAAATVQALAAVPGAVGVNNHMGSLLSADPGAMDAVLEVLAERGLFFLDSRTSAESVAYATARRLGVAAAERQVFLDGDRRPEAIRGQFRRLLDLARERGAAIAIGHPYAETFTALAELIPEAEAAGYEFVPVSYLLDDPGAPPL